MKKHLSTVLLVLMLAAGVCLLAYPSVSDWWNSQHQSQAIETYSQDVSAVDGAAKQRLWERAQDYNARLAQEGNTWVLTQRQRDDYESQLRVPNTDVLCYVDIPSIRCMLPVYRGTDDAILQTAIGHIEGSSLPVGGPSTHCVLSGHRGLPSAKLFTNLDRLVEGDTFTLHTLDTTLAYQVDQILIVEPDDLSALAIVEGEDLCTLVTCTPYGVNSHRLLVRGHRVNVDESALVSADAVRIEPVLVAICIAMPVLLVLFIGAMAFGGRRREVRK